MQNNRLIQVMKQAKSRIKAKTPPWFRFIRNASLLLTGAGTIIASSVIPLPSTIITIGGYCAIAGSVAALVAQTAIDNE
jgi:hypothetical protein